MSNKTIAAIATSQSPGGIGVIRVSGSAAIFIAKTLFHPKKPLDWSALTGYRMAYGYLAEPPSPPAGPIIREQSTTCRGELCSPASITHPAGADTICPPSPSRDSIRTQRSDQAPPQVVDECILLIFPAPHSYTGEHVVEFQLHGGPAILRRALNAVFAAGAQPAQPGEFTRRAYLNGRIDLARAEAVMQLVSATGEQAARAAAAAMGGALSQRIEAIRASLTALAAHIAAWVDYPEDDIPALQPAELSATLSTAIQDLQTLLRNAPRDQLMLSGVNTALLGKPNVGKSSLMNLLAGYDRSIVTNRPGTTRDTVTETVQLGNLQLRLTDTAGIHNTSDAIEAAGVARSRAALAQADLLLLVVDASQPLTEEDHALFALCDPTRSILILNKSDLPQATLIPDSCHLSSIHISALTGHGLEDLTAAIESLLGTANFSPHEAILANHRQSNCAAQALAALEEALCAAQAGIPLDAISVCLEDAIQALYTLTGERAADAIVDEVFASFCVGK